jgi:hypothetical protein
MGLTAARVAPAQTTFTWNNTGADWTAGADWTSAAGTTGTAPGASDIAQFAPFFGPSVTNPSIPAGAAPAVAVVAFGPNPVGGGYTLTGGAGSSLTLNTTGVTFPTNLNNTLLGGLVVRTPLTTLSVPTVTIAASPFNTAIEIASSGTLTLTSGTTLNISGTTQFTELRGSGATLTFDNRAAGPVPQFIQGGQNLRTNAGGTLVFLGNATTASAFSIPALSAGPGDTVFVINQPGTAATTVTSPSMARFNTAATYFFRNAGTGTLGGGPGNPAVTFTTAPATSNGVIVQSATAASPFALVTTNDSTLVQVQAAFCLSGSWGGHR